MSAELARFWLEMLAYGIAGVVACDTFTVARRRLQSEAVLRLVPFFGWRATFIVWLIVLGVWL